MTYKTKAVLIILALVLLLTLGWAQRVESDQPAGAILATSTDAALASSAAPAEAKEPETAPRTYPSSAARIEASEAAYEKVKAEGTEDPEEWLLALEWCESRGRPSAVNPNDRDNTPSYGLLQFKPSTFDFFTKAYGLPEKELMDPDAQRAIVRRMMQDPSIRWENQFPDCVKRHIGRPPSVIQ